jgi:hypothetical protein
MTERERERTLGAMRSGEWLRTQWIARVAYELGSAPPEIAIPYIRRARAVLKQLEAEGMVERRAAAERRSGEIGGAPVVFDIPREEWRAGDDSQGEKGP